VRSHAREARVVERAQDLYAASRKIALHGSSRADSFFFLQGS